MTSPDAILEELLAHRPVPNGVVRRAITIRWAGTIVCSLLAPVGLAVGMFDTHKYLPFSGWAAAAIAAGGMLAFASGWFARRRQGLDGQWGFAPLKGAEVEEMFTLAGNDPGLGRVVDTWACRWLESGSNFRGRDLMLLRRLSKKYLDAKQAASVISDQPGT